MADPPTSLLDEEKDVSDDLPSNILPNRDPLTRALSEESDVVEFDASPNSNVKLDETVKLDDTLDEGLAGLKFEQDFENETKDLFVVVDNPEKHTTTMESYTTFRITTKTTRSEFDSHEYCVRRRYNDFLWLRQRLEEEHPTHLIPPLPEKHSLRRFDRFSPEFIKTRQAALEKFLTRIADHPVLSFNKHVQIFITAKQWEFQAHKKQGSGVLSRMADSIQNMSASYMMKNRNLEFTMMQEYIQTFADKLGTVDRINHRLNREQLDYLNSLMEWGPVFTLWSNSEDRLNPALGGMAKAAEDCCKSLQEVVDSTEMHFTQPLKEYQLYADAIKAVLRRRDAIQMHYEMTVEEVNRKKDEKDQVRISDQSYSLGAFLGKDPEAVKKSKLEKLDQNIEELTKQVEVLNDKSVIANADLKADMERWHKNKKKDFKQLYMELCDRNIQYYESCLAAWEEAIPLIQKTDLLTDNTELSGGPLNDEELESPDGLTPSNAVASLGGRC